MLFDCTGAILAGGRARRLGGIAKGLLRLDGEAILHRTLRLFERLFPASLLVTSDPDPYSDFGVPIVPDALPGKGAPGGLHAALTASKTDWVFAAACDMPFPSAEGIALLAELRPGADAVMVHWEGRLQPLHSLWSRRCLATLEPLLREGNPSLRILASQVRTRIVPEESWRAVDPDGRAFENANTAADAARLGLALPGPD